VVVVASHDGLGIEDSISRTVCMHVDRGISWCFSGSNCMHRFQTSVGGSVESYKAPGMHTVAVFFGGCVAICTMHECTRVAARGTFAIRSTENFTRI
jgi:hypothetical protein